MTHSPMRYDRTTFVEAYGRGAIGRAAAENRRNLNVTGLRVLDLRTTMDDGTCWDLSKPSHRRKALQLIEELDPDWIIAAPPCTAFYTPNYGFNYPRRRPEDVDEKIATDIMHLKVCCQLYRRQIKREFFSTSIRGWLNRGMRKQYETS